MPAFTARSIYVCPLDGRNLNRVFPGDARGTASEQIADWVFRNVDFAGQLLRGPARRRPDRGARSVHHFLPVRQRSASTRCRWRWPRSSAFIFSCAARRPARRFAPHRAPAFPPSWPNPAARESGRPKTSPCHTNGLYRLMRHLDMIPGGAPEPVPFTLLERFLWLRSDHEGFWYPAVAVDEEVKGRSGPRLRDGLRRPRAADSRQPRRRRRPLHRHVVGDQRRLIRSWPSAREVFPMDAVLKTPADNEALPGTVILSGAARRLFLSRKSRRPDFRVGPSSEESRSDIENAKDHNSAQRVLAPCAINPLLPFVSLAEPARPSAGEPVAGVGASAPEVGRPFTWTPF